MQSSARAPNEYLVLPPSDHEATHLGVLLELAGLQIQVGSQLGPRRRRWSEGRAPTELERGAAVGSRGVGEGPGRVPSIGG